MQIALFEPKIPQNVGNIIRLCANTGAELHLIHPLGFVWDDKRLRRAGLDYGEFARVMHHQNWGAFMAQMAGKRLWALTTRARRSALSAEFAPDDVLVFGSETAGLSEEAHAAIAAEYKLRLPMQHESRSLNLANSVAVMTYLALSQQIDKNALYLA